MSNLLSDVSTGLGVAGDLLGAFGSLAAGKAQAKGYSAAAGFAGQAADLTGQMNALKLVQDQRRTTQILGGQRADIAGSGLALSGSALDVVGNSARDASLNSAMIRMQGQIDVGDWLSKQQTYQAQADAAKKSGGGGFLGGLLKVATTVAPLLL